MKKSASEEALFFWVGISMHTDIPIIEKDLTEVKPFSPTSNVPTGGISNIRILLSVMQIWAVEKVGDNFFCPPFSPSIPIAS